VPYFLLSIIHCVVTLNPIQLCILLHIQNQNGICRTYISWDCLYLFWRLHTCALLLAVNHSLCCNHKSYSIMYFATCSVPEWYCIGLLSAGIVFVSFGTYIHVPYFLLSIIHWVVTVNPIQLCNLLHIQNQNGICRACVQLGLFVFVLGPKKCLTVFLTTILSLYFPLPS
jgi:hypothetical protein